MLLEVQVQDEGVGMSPDDIKNLFNPFAMAGR